MHFRSYITITLLVTTVPWIVSQNEVEFIGWVECHYRATHCDFQNELDSLLKQFKNEAKVV